ncbi:MAG: hypothetical protein JOY92_02340 [Verrucomicrobia bacterium]|nr:hypothetical protein [Verrucomicrobiota bacterium]
MLPLTFSSALPADRRDELEELMFFHPEQGEHTASINAAIEAYGFPKILQEDGSLRIGIAGLDVQTLYAFVPRGSTQELAGVTVYTRTSDDTLVLLHMAVKPEFSFASGYRNELVLPRMLGQLRVIAKRIKGIKRLSIVYADHREVRPLSQAG